jgi:hypothetical protein
MANRFRSDERRFSASLARSQCEFERPRVYLERDFSETSGARVPLECVWHDEIDISPWPKPAIEERHRGYGIQRARMKDPPLPLYWCVETEDDPDLEPEHGPKSIERVTSVFEGPLSLSKWFR